MSGSLHSIIFPLFSSLFSLAPHFPASSLRVSFSFPRRTSLSELRVASALPFIFRFPLSSAFRFWASGSLSSVCFVPSLFEPHLYFQSLVDSTPARFAFCSGARASPDIREQPFEALCVFPSRSSWVPSTIGAVRSLLFQVRCPFTLLQSHGSPLRPG